MSVILAIDIGGTQLRVAVYPTASTTPRVVQKTPTRGQEQGVYDRLVALIDSVFPKDEVVEAISVACPGPTNPFTGVIASTPNIPAWKDFPLAGMLSERYKVPAYLGNDANMAALGEWKYGAGQGHSDVLYLTISTGIGGGVISSGMLVVGTRGLATELGHMVVLPGGPLCGCGLRGHLEAVASGPAIARYVNEQLAVGCSSSLKPGPNLDARTIAEAARQGDKLAIDAYAQAGEFIGQALADFLHAFNPSIVIFGGGVSQAGSLLLDPVRDSMERHVMNPSYLDGLQIATARLGDEAGLLGALAQAHIRLSSTS